ncbi:hypothetical protein FQZ97_899740 [compost metagenome]
MAGAGGFEHHAALAGYPIVLEVFPGALDGVDDHRAGVMMAGQGGPGGCLEQGNGLAANRVAFDVFEQHLIAVGRERNPGQVFVIDGGGIDAFVQHFLVPRDELDQSPWWACTRTS